MNWLPWNRRENRLRDLDEEIETDLFFETRRRMEYGATPEEAKRAARKAFGNVTRVKEVTNEMWGFGWLERVVRDLRFAGRLLRKRPGFTAVAALTLALGIGANTAVFSVLNTVLLQPLPFQNADRLVGIFSARTNGSLQGPSVPDLQDFQTGNHTFERMTIYDVWRKNVSGILGGSAPEQMRVGLVSGEFFRVLGIQPVMGRLFTPAEEEFGRHYVAAVGSAFWKNRFAGRSDVLGQKILINDEPYTIVAVMPDAVPDWMEHPKVEVWTPFATALRPGLSTENQRGGRDNKAIGLLKRNVSVQQAQADLGRIAESLARLHPIDQGVGVAVKPLSDTRVGELRPVLYMLTGAVTLILLIACTNLANLLLARNSTRTRELVMRFALGAKRADLVRQLVTETLTITLLGGVLGFALAWAGCLLLAHWHPEELPQLQRIEPDGRTLLFTLLISLGTGLLCGLLPALTTTQVNLVEALKEGGRSGTAGVGRQYLRRGLVAAEVAFSLMLLAAAGLLTQSLVRLQKQATGIREDHLLKAHFYLPPAHYPNPPAITRFCERFSEKIRSLPGVTNGTVTTVYPPNDRWAQIFSVEGQTPADSQELPTTRFGVTDERYLRTMGIPLLEGRDFDPSDTESRPAVALINREFAARYFRGRNPLGVRIHLGQPVGRTVSAPPNPIAPGAVTVIGVTENFRNNGLAFPIEPQLMTLFRQEPSVNFGFKDVVVRTAVDPHRMTRALRQQLQTLDPNLPLAEIQTMDEYVSRQTSNERFISSLLGLFAALGLLLTMLGIYGVVSFLVQQRTSELGIRLALGASPFGVLWLVIRQALMVGLTGVLVGLCGAASIRKLLSSLLFQVTATDLAGTLLSVCVGLLLMAALASAVPGLRAMRIDAVSALREE